MAANDPIFFPNSSLKKKAEYPQDPTSDCAVCRISSRVVSMCMCRLQTASALTNDKTEEVQCSVLRM